MTSWSDETRAYLSKNARLLGPGDAGWAEDADLKDAASLLQLTGLVHGLRSDLHDADADARVLAAVDTWIVVRAARVVFEKVWESRRRRTAGQPLLGDKYAVGGIWAPAAVELVLTADGTIRPRKEWSGQLRLEHVVPAETVQRLLAQAAREDRSPADVAAMLRAVAIHTVTRERDEPEAKLMSQDAEQSLVGHFFGGVPLSQPELDEACWSRYLAPQTKGCMTFKVSDLRTLSDAIAERSDA